MTSTHYCIWGQCESQQYCCGDYVCCNETDFNSLLLTAIILGSIIVMALCCTWFYCSSRRLYAPFVKKYFRISYNLMSSQQDGKGSSAIKQESVMEACTV